MPSCLVPDFAALPPPPFSAHIGRVRLCALVPALYAQQLLWHGAPILFHLFRTIFSLISPQNHIRIANHARDAFRRSSSCPIGLCCSLIWGCFVAAACSYYSIIVSKVKGSLPGSFICFLVACSRVDGGRRIWGGKAWRAYARCRAPNSSRCPSFVLAFVTLMIAMCIVAFCDA